jgi:hypothetical protein
MLSGEVGSVSRPGGERGGKTSLAHATNCIKLCDAPRSTAKNCAILPLAIPRNFAPVLARSLALRVNSARLREKEAFAAKNMKSEKVCEKADFSIDDSEVRNGRIQATPPLGLLLLRGRRTEGLHYTSTSVALNRSTPPFTAFSSAVTTSGSKREMASDRMRSSAKSRSIAD